MTEGVTREHVGDIEMDIKTPLLSESEGDDDTDFDHISQAGTSTSGDNWRHHQGKQYGAFTHEARQSTESTEKFFKRFILLGGDDNLMNQAHDRILRITVSNNTSHHKACELREGHVNGHQLSVLKTPSNWLQRLRSTFIFRHAVKSLKNEMEGCESLVFPGPHAFLLVLKDARNTGKEHYFLRALSNIFGKESLDYCTVLFMQNVTPNEAAQNQCVRKCNYRYHILENTDRNVKELFSVTEKMVQSKKTKFFTNNIDYFLKAKCYFQMEFEAEKKLIMEKKEKQIKEIKKQHAEIMQKLKEAHRNEDLLRGQLNTPQPRSEKNVFRDRETQLKDDNKKLQRDVEQLKAQMEQIAKSLSGTQVQKAFHHAKLQSKSEARDRELVRRDIQSSGDIQYEHHGRDAFTPPGDECEEETDEDSGASRSQPFDGSRRRSSSQIDKPSMSGSRHTPQ